MGSSSVRVGVKEGVVITPSEPTRCGVLGFSIEYLLVYAPCCQCHLLFSKVSIGKSLGSLLPAGGEGAVFNFHRGLLPPLLLHSLHVPDVLNGSPPLVLQLNHFAHLAKSSNNNNNILRSPGSRISADLKPTSFTFDKARLQELKTSWARALGFPPNQTLKLLFSG